MPWDGSGSRCCSKDEIIVHNVVKERCPFTGICMDWLTWFPRCSPPTESIVGGTRLFTESIFCWFVFFFLSQKITLVLSELSDRDYSFPSKGSHLCLKTRSVCKSVCDDCDEECEWVEKHRRHVFMASSLSVLTSLSECMAQWSAGSWSPETECYVSLVLLSLQIGFSRICFGPDDEVWLNMVIDTDIWFYSNK